jgi:O-antigen/teichoic acid export membrane protein
LGIIQKQALRTTVLSLFGSVFGSVTRIGMSLLITEAQIGLMQLLDAISGLFSIIFSLGYEQVLSKLFPTFRDEEKGHHGFLVFGIMLSLVGTALSFLIYYFFSDFFLTDNPQTNQLFKAFSFLVFPLIFFRIVFRNLDGYAKMLFSTVIGVFLDGFVSKLILACGILAFYLTYIDYEYLLYVYTICFSIPGIVIAVYAFAKTKNIVLPHKSLVGSGNRKRLGEYMLFGIMVSASGSIVLYVDSVMVNKLISLEALGVYSILFFAARLIAIPAKGIIRISNVVIAESWKKNDLKNIQDIYSKSCLNQMLIAAFMFGVGWACLDTVMQFSPKLASYSAHIYVFFFLGLGLTVEMATGVNAVIIATSTKFRYNTYFGFLLAILIIIFNFIFIYFYGIEGAAIASMLAMVIINLLRWLMLYKSFNLQPFNANFLKGLLISIAFIILCSFIDLDIEPKLKLLIYFLGLSGLFWIIVIRLKISEDINAWLSKIKNTLIKRKQ